MNRSIFAAAAALATVASFSATTPAFANSTSSAVTVAFNDLDLDSGAGQARLDRRIQRAARSVCEASTGHRPLPELLATARCMRDASESARTRVAAARGDNRFGG